MEIKVLAITHGLSARSFRWPSAVVPGKRYHGFQCGNGWIIESPDACDKRSSSGIKKFPCGEPENAPVEGILSVLWRAVLPESASTVCQKRAKKAKTSNFLRFGGH
jgi:hypothetical protein